MKTGTFTKGGPFRAHICYHLSVVSVGCALLAVGDLAFSLARHHTSPKPSQPTTHPPPTCSHLPVPGGWGRAPCHQCCLLQPILVCTMQCRSIVRFLGHLKCSPWRNAQSCSSLSPTTKTKCSADTCPGAATAACTWRTACATSTL